MRQLSFNIIKKLCFFCAIRAYKRIKKSGLNSEFEIFAAIYRSTKNKRLRCELEKLFNTEIRRPGSVFNE